MPTSFTTNLRLSNPGLGDTGWGSTVSNGMIDLTDQAIAGQASVDVSGAGPFVLTMPDGTSGDARNMFLRFTGNPGGAREVRVPTNRKLYFVTNDSDGAVTVKVSGQTGVVVPVGASMALRINAAGTDVVQALTHQASLTLSTALVATSGGTGQTGYAVGDLLYASSTTALSKLTVGAANAVLTSSGTAPQWTATLGVVSGGTGAATLTGYVKGNGTGAMTASANVPVGDISGTLPVANGGTGAATLASGGYLKGNGTGAVTSQVGIPASDITSGTVDTTRLGSGTANSGTYLRGDQTWATISTTDVLNAMASASVGAIGTYAFLNPLSASTVAPGGTLAGGSLQYGPNSAGSSSPSGTWRLMGNLSTSTTASVWLRIS